MKTGIKIVAAFALLLSVSATAQTSTSSSTLSNSGDFTQGLGVIIPSHALIATKDANTLRMDFTPFEPTKAGQGIQASHGDRPGYVQFDNQPIGNSGIKAPKKSQMKWSYMASNGSQRQGKVSIAVANLPAGLELSMLATDIDKSGNAGALVKRLKIRGYRGDVTSGFLKASGKAPKVLSENPQVFIENIGSSNFIGNDGQHCHFYARIVDYAALSAYDMASDKATITFTFSE